MKLEIILLVVSIIMAFNVIQSVVATSNEENDIKIDDSESRQADRDSQGAIDTTPNEVCVCDNETGTIPQPEPEQKIAQNVTVVQIRNVTDIGNFTKILSDKHEIALIPLANNTTIKILANVSNKMLEECNCK